MLISGFSMEQLEENVSDKIENNDEQYISQDEYDILMDQLGRAILAQKLLETYRHGSYLNDDERTVEKRHPKWRSGETRSRVKSSCLFVSKLRVQLQFKCKSKPTV